MTFFRFLFACFALLLPVLAVSADGNEAAEPKVKGPDSIDLLAGGTLAA